MIQITNITKEYNGYKAVNDLSLNLQKGEIYGLVGKNGAGKSTLFKLILGLTHANSGKISIMNSKNDRELRAAKHKIGFYMGSSFYPYLNARDNLKYVATMKNIKDPHEIERVLKLVDMDQVKKPFKAYSLGMKQRLGIANALLGDPEIVLLDEPINGLDPQGILEIRQIIQNLKDEHHKTVIVSSHILSELELVADRFGIIHQGVLIKEIDKNQSSTSGSTIVLKTDNQEASFALLSDLNPRFNDDGIYIDIDHLSNEHIQIIINNKISILEIKTHKENLEQQYFALTGGQK